MSKVLVVEDDLMIADMVEAILVVRGYTVCGIGRTVAEAVSLGREHKPDLAIIDLRLAGGELGTEVATQLSGLGRLGILYASGNVSQVVQTATTGDACLAKPYCSADLLRSLEIVTDILTTGRAQPPFPRGFRVLDPATAAAENAPHE